MTEKPVFSIVLATYGRGRHITPTIESVLQQDFDDFELLVVGDACEDETESVVRSFSDKRIAWHNLEKNTGSQAFPNNEGIRVSRGDWIAYIGHDDIWTPDHLSKIYAVHVRDKNADFIISGCVMHTPPGTGVYHVLGLFDDPASASRYFFPPSCIAHRRDVTERIGSWGDPRSTTRAVDHDFMWRGTSAGMKFVSTGAITTHKFAAGHRYLSYLRVVSDEQRDMLDALINGDAADTAHIVDAAKRTGTFMWALPENYGELHKPGFLFEKNRENRGLLRPQLLPLQGRTIVRQTDEARAMDWYGLEQRGEKQYRWSGPNPKPKILIPYTGRRARIELEVLSPIQPGLALHVDQGQIPFHLETQPDETSRIVAEIPLKADGYTVLTLNQPTVPLSALDKGPNHRPVGIAIADIVLDPVSWISTFKNLFWRSPPGRSNAKTPTQRSE